MKTKLSRIFLFSGAICLIFALFILFANGQKPLQAKAYAADSDYQMLIPSDASEYLDLSSVSAIATTDQGLAIADSNTLYYWNADRSAYSLYRFSDAIVRIQSDSNGNLWILTDEGTLLHYSPEARTVTDLKTACKAFAIGNGYLYYATKTSPMQLLYAPITDLSKTTVLNTFVSDGNTVIYYGENLYFTVGTTLYRYTDFSSGSFKNLSTDSLTDFAVINDVIYYTSSNGTLHRAPYFTNDETSFTSHKSYLLCNDGASLYTADHTAIYRFDTQANQYDGFSICAQSNAAHRFSRASDLVLANEALYIADTGNNSFCIYSLTDCTVEKILCPIAPEVISANSQAILIANARTALILDREGKTLHSTTFAQAVISATEYGGYFAILLANGEVLSLSSDFSTESLCKDASFTELSTDYGGNLYALSDSGELVGIFATNEVVSYFSSGASCLAFDRSNRAYALTASGIVNSANTTYPLDFSHLTDSDCLAMSLSHVNGNAYLLYSDFLVQIPLNHSHLGTLTASHVYLDEPDPAPRAIELSANTPAYPLEFSFTYHGSLNVDTQILLPTHTYLLLLAEIDEFYLGYSESDDLCYLVHKDRAIALQSVLSEQTEVRYVAYPTAPSAFPTLNHTQTDLLTKGTALNVHGAVTLAGNAYLFVSYPTGGGVAYGYVSQTATTAICLDSSPTRVYKAYASTSANLTFYGQDGSVYEQTRTLLVTVYESENTTLVSFYDEDGNIFTADATGKELETYHSVSITLSLLVLLSITLIFFCGTTLFKKPTD